MSKTTIPTGGITADAIDATKIADDAISEEHLDATALTLTSATAGTDEMYCVYLGKTVGTVSPASDSVTTTMLQADAVTTAKILNGNVTGAKFNADVISGQTELATTPADTDELLLSDAGVLKRIDYSHIKGSNTDLSNLSSTGKEKIVSAWVNWTGDNTIGDSQNVSGVTENANGDYTITFSSAMANDDYAVSGLAKSNDNAGVRGAYMNFSANNTSMTTGSFRINIQYENTSLRDPEQVCVMVIGAPS